MGMVVQTDAFVNRWADTCEMVSVLYGSAEVDRRAKPLPQEFKSKLIAELKERGNGERG